jgi:sugar-specific transcriptional regulator TrmB
MKNPKENIIREFLRMGISAQEVKAYISLLEQEYVTGYQLSKSAGIPSSKIYSVLNRLLERGFVIAANTRPVRYVPRPPEELLAGIRDDFRASLEALENSLKGIRNGTGKKDIVAWNTTGRADVMRKSRSMIEHSTEKVYLAVWPQDLRPIRASLSEAVKRGVKLHLVSYGNTTFDRGTIYFHRPSDYPFRERRERRFVLTSDSSKAVIASFGPDGAGNGIWTENPGLVNLFKDFVIHEIYIVKIEEAFPRQIRAAYGRDWERIRMV